MLIIVISSGIAVFKQLLIVWVKHNFNQVSCNFRYFVTWTVSTSGLKIPNKEYSLVTGILVSPVRCCQLLCEGVVTLSGFCIFGQNKKFCFLFWWPWSTELFHSYPFFYQFSFILKTTKYNASDYPRQLEPRPFFKRKSQTSQFGCPA